MVDKSGASNPQVKAEDMVEMLKAGMFEEFRAAFKSLSRDIGPFEIAELVNRRLKELDPECDAKLIVSQKTNSDKHIVMIMDGSRFFGDAFTVTRQMFVV